MKFKDTLIIALIISTYILVIKGFNCTIEKIEALEVELTGIKVEVEEIQKDYVRIDDLQPALDDLAVYSEEMEYMKANLNDFNGLWNQLFGYEQKKYIEKHGKE